MNNAKIKTCEMSKERMESALNQLMQHFQRAGISVPESLAVMQALQNYISQRMGMKLESIHIGSGGVGEHGN